jgi:hypothetical protein
VLLETRAGRQAPAPDPGKLPLLSITDRPEGRATDDHGAGLLHYDHDFERLAAHTDLAVALEPLVPLGSIP